MWTGNSFTSATGCSSLGYRHGRWQWLSGGVKLRPGAGGMNKIKNLRVKSIQGFVGEYLKISNCVFRVYLVFYASTRTVDATMYKRSILYAYELPSFLEHRFSNSNQTVQHCTKLAAVR